MRDVVIAAEKAIDHRIGGVKAADQGMDRAQDCDGDEDQRSFEERSANGVTVIPVTVAGLRRPDADVSRGIDALCGVVVGFANDALVIVEIGDAMMPQAHGDIDGPAGVE